MEFLRDNVFHKKFEEDDRESMIRIGRWGMTGTITMDPSFMAQMIVLQTITHLLCIAASLITYYGIVVVSSSSQTNQEKHTNRPRDSLQGCLLGYGIVLPLLLCTPYYLIASLNVRNCLLLLSVVGIPVLSALRLLEALHSSRLPKFAQESALNFLIYFAIPMVVDHNDTRLVKATAAQLRHKVVKMISLFLQGTLFVSLMSEFEYKVFPSRAIETVGDFVFWGNICNNLMVVSLLSILLDLSCSFAEFVFCILTGGLHFVPSHNSPMTTSTSISMFWGSRWNRLVADSLKRGVFRPLRRFAPRSVAAILTFLASGVAHEYMLFVLSSARGHCYYKANNLTRQPYQHQLGRQFGFFVWNGVLLILEELLRENVALLWIQKNFPKPIRKMFMLLLVLPISFLFTDEYDESGIFRDTAMSLPRIRYLEDSAPLLSYPLDEMFIDGHNWTMNLINGSRDDPCAIWSLFHHRSTSVYSDFGFANT